MQRQSVSNRRRQQEAHDASHSSRLQTAARLVFLPLYAARALLQLPSSISFAEDAQNAQHTRREAGSACSLVIPRITYCLQDFMLLWQALVLNLIMGAVHFLAAEGTVSRLQGWLESAGNKAIGLTRQSTSPKLRLTLANLPAPSFDSPTNYSAMHFPWTGAAGWVQGAVQRACLAHFMSQCARLGCESPRAISAVVDGLWGCELIAHGRHTGPVPVSWYAFSNCEAVVLSFTGSSALNLLSWGAAPSVTVSERAGMGSVSDMYTGALFNLPQGADECAFDAALGAVAHLAGTRALLLTGHGSGGALACVFALGLKLKRPHLSCQVEGIYTFGQPCAGDAAFADKLRAAYSGCLHCFELPADICPRLPPSHKFASLKQLPGHGRRSCVKMLPPPAPSNWAQLLSKSALSLLPGVWQHQPWAYEQALREQVSHMPVLLQADEDHEESTATTVTLPPSEALNGRWAHGYPKGLFDSTGQTSDRSHNNTAVSAAWAAKQSSAVLSQSASPTGSLMSALSDLRRGELPHHADGHVGAQRALFRPNRDGNVWSIGTGRQDGSQQWQEPPRPKAPSIQTAADTVYWSMHEGLPTERSNDKGRVRPSRLQTANQLASRQAPREEQDPAGDSSMAPHAHKSGLYITPLDMMKTGPVSPASSADAGTQSSVEQAHHDGHPSALEPCNDMYRTSSQNLQWPEST